MGAYIIPQNVLSTSMPQITMNELNREAVKASKLHE